MTKFGKIIMYSALIAVPIVGFVVFRNTLQQIATILPTTSTRTPSNLPLINISVTANLGKHFIINFKPLKENLKSIQSKYPQKTYIYLSYLNSGTWVGLNEKDDFAAASMIKVPLAMAVMKSVEDGKLKLSDSYSLEELDLNEGFGDLYKVGQDGEFTVGELLKIMLEKSDNTAANALYSIFHKIGIDDPFEQVYGFLGWEFGSTNIRTFGELPDYSVINLKTLSSLFVALYDAKYISPENSSMILDYLAHTPFNDKLVAGVPKDIIVSHKIGVSAGNKTFSDCGIVYAPNRNYILCFGSEGADEDTATKFMAEASAAVYKYIINN